MGESTSSANSAWAAVKTKFAETPAKGPCIPCQAKKKALVGPKWEKDAKDVFPGHQSFNDCGLQASRQVVEQAKGKLDMSERQFMDNAIATCTVDPDGASSTQDRQCVMQQYGVPSTLKDANIGNVDAALRDGKGVIITANSRTLWAMEGINVPQGGPHAVLLTNGIYDGTGKLTGVNVNDTGTGTRYVMSTDDLQKAMDTGGGLMNVTDKPIWPSD